MEAVGLASSILTFMEVAYEIVRGSYEIYKAGTGATEENYQISIVIEDLNKAASGLKVGHQRPGDAALAEIADKCEGISQQLIDLLQKVKRKTDGKWDTFVAALKAFRKQKEVLMLNTRLGEYRQEIILRIGLLLYEQQSPVKAELDELRRKGTDLSNESARKMEDIQNQLIDTLEALRDLREKTNIAVETMQALQERDETIVSSESTPESSNEASGASKTLHDLVTQMIGLRSLVETMPKENRVLRMLYFSSIFRREGDITDPAGETFDWMVADLSRNDSDTSLVQLSPMTLQEQPGDSTDPVPNILPSKKRETVQRKETARAFRDFLFHDGSTFFVCGKAGCGKSTLMKFLGHKSNQRVQESLRVWAGKHKLVIIRMFFWRSNELLQKSVEGFYRTILFQVLRQCPELISAIFPERSLDDFPDAVEFQVEDLQRAFKILISMQGMDDYRVCCFLDGLDEHQGQDGNLSYDRLATQLASWAESDHVKIVCSARPETVFINIFSESGTIIHMHELTRGDIVDYAQCQFKTCLGKPHLQAAQKRCLGFVDEIGQEAQGVFLWASLVVLSMINAALADDYSDSTLGDKLRYGPDKLNSVLKAMLHKPDWTPIDRKRSDVMLHLAVHNPFNRPLSALAFSWLESDDLDWLQDLPSNKFPFNRQQQLPDEGEIATRQVKTRSLLQRLTGGLLEMVDTEEPVPYFQFRVDFFHRSARSFLEENWKPGSSTPVPCAQTDLMELFCRLRLAEIKFTPFPKFSDEASVETTSRSLLCLWENTFEWLADCTRSDGGALHSHACIREFDRISTSNIHDQAFLGRMKVDYESSRRWHRRDGHPVSFIHWAAYWRQGSYVREQLANGHHASSVADPDLNILLTSSIAADGETVRYLLKNGHSPQDTIHFKPRKPNLVQSPAAGTVWMVFLRDLASNIRMYCWRRRHSSAWPFYLNMDWMERLAEVCEMYLRAGADASVYYVIWFPDISTRYRVDLGQMIAVFKPKSQDSIQKLLNRRLWLESTTALATWLVGEKPKSPYATCPRTTLENLVNLNWKIVGVVSEKEGDLLGIFEFRAF